MDILLKIILNNVVRSNVIKIVVYDFNYYEQ